MDISLREAFKIAVEVHGDQRDKAGEPYLFHVMRVAMAMDTDEERVVAILHDVIEDMPGGIEVMLTALIGMVRKFGITIHHAVIALTRYQDEPYLEYIRRLSTNPLAVKVKLADLRDNTDSKRLAKLPSHESARLIAKYTEAFRFLKPEPPPEEDMHE